MVANITPQAWLGKAHDLDWLEQANEAALDEAIAYQQEQDTAKADSLVQQGEWPDPADYAGLR